MMMKRIYISGKMTGLTRLQIQERFAQAERHLRNRGFNTCNPARFIFCRWKWLYWLMGYFPALCIDIYMLSRCDGIYMVGSDWKESRGASLENSFAQIFDKEIIS